MTYRLRSVRVWMLIGATAMACTLVAGPGVAQEQRVAYVQVVDRQGQPVTDLALEEFQVAEDGVPGRVVSARIGTDPMRVALLVDNGEGMRLGRAVNLMRDAVAAFIENLSPRHPVSLFTIGGRTRQIVDFTTDRTELVEQARGLFTRHTRGIRFVDSIRETLEHRYDGNEVWPVFVALIADSGEAKAFLNQQRYRSLIDSVRARGVIVHVVQWTKARRARPEPPFSARELGPGSRGEAEVWAERDRMNLTARDTRGRGSSGALTTIALDLTAATGGRYVPVVAGSGMTPAMTRLANDMGANYDAMSTRYIVTYDRPDPPGQRVTMRITRPEVVLQLFRDRAMDR